MLVRQDELDQVVDFPLVEAVELAGGVSVFGVPEKVVEGGGAAVVEESEEDV